MTKTEWMDELMKLIKAKPEGLVTLMLCVDDEFYEQGKREGRFLCFADGLQTKLTALIPMAITENEHLLPIFKIGVQAYEHVTMMGKSNLN